jgi:hypothetical protein
VTAKLRQPMALTIRIPKTYPGLDRREARALAQEIAEGQGHQPDTLRKSNTRIEAVDGAVPWVYVVEFPDASS